MNLARNSNRKNLKLELKTLRIFLDFPTVSQSPKKIKLKAESRREFVLTLSISIKAQVEAEPRERECVWAAS